MTMKEYNIYIDNFCCVLLWNIFQVYSKKSLSTMFHLPPLSTSIDNKFNIHHWGSLNDRPKQAENKPGWHHPLSYHRFLKTKVMIPINSTQINRVSVLSLW